LGLNNIHSSREQPIIPSSMSEIRPSSVRSLARHFFHGATTGETPESEGGAPAGRSCRGRFCPAVLLPGEPVVSLRLVSRERRMSLRHRGETSSGAKMNSREMAAVWYHFAPWRKNLREGCKQHSDLGLRTASRSAREHGPGQQRICPPGRGDLVEEIVRDSVRLKPDLLGDRRGKTYFRGVMGVYERRDVRLKPDLLEDFRPFAGVQRSSR
jgi:hypothetical protein